VPAFPTRFAVALTSTLYTLDIALSHVDRNVYEALALRVPMHPSESPEYFVARVLAYCLEYTEGIVFSRGVSDPDEPTIAVRDLTGALQAWIEIGAPDATRLHRAAKAAPRVAIYTHRDPAQLLRQLAGQKIHKASSIPLYSIERALIDAVATRLDRRMKIDITCADGTLYVTIGGDVLSGTVERHALPAM
jgi:uncharacterized protein YaeQ